MKWAALVLVTTALFSCQKEATKHESTAHVAQAAATDPVAEGIMNSKTISFTYPNCTLAHGHFCTPYGGSCLLRFPPGSFTGEFEVPIRFYSPTVTGQGETGTQMVLEFLDEAPGIADGILGPDEWDEATIVVHQQLTTALGYSSIEVINKVYTPVFNTQYPYGYVVYDCKVKK